jgi:hypothetical protein
MPSFRELSFDAYVQEFIKDVGNHDDGCVSLALEYFASLRYVQALIDCDGETSAAEVEQLKAALLRAADAHPNRPTLKVIRTVKARRAHRDQSCSNSRYPFGYVSCCLISTRARQAHSKHIASICRFTCSNHMLYFKENLLCCIQIVLFSS